MTIISLIDRQQTQLTQLSALILDEKHALIDQDPELLLTLSQQKSQLLQAIHQLDQDICAHDEQQQLLADSEGRQGVENIQQLLGQCKHLNQDNQRLIETNMASLNRLAQALQTSKNTSSLTYDDKGKTSTISSLGNNVTA